MNREIRMKGKGTVHFIDEYKRPRELKDTIVVDYQSIFQTVFVKVEIEYEIQTNPPTKGTQQYLMPFTSVCYIEWDLVEP